MKKNDRKELLEKSNEELEKTLEELRKDFFDKSMEKEQGKLKDTSSLTNIRKQIAVIMTFMRQKEILKNA